MNRLKLILMIACLGIQFFPSNAVFAEGQMLDRVVAVVNDDPITQSELDAYLRPLYRELKEQFPGQDEMIGRRLQEMRSKLLNQVIEDRLVYQKAKDMKIDVSEADLEKEVSRFQSRFKNGKDFEASMSKEGFSLKALRDKLSRQIMIRRLHDMEIRSRIVVTPVEVESFFKENSSDFVQKDQVRVRSITLKKNDQAREKGLMDEDSKKRIEEIRKQALASPDSFGDLARKFSEDYQAAQGGLGDWVEPGAMIPEIDSVIFAMKQGDISEIIETPMGYHLFKVEEKQEKKERTFEEVRNEIYDRLYREKAEKRFSGWMEDLKREAYISLRS